MEQKYKIASQVFISRANRLKKWLVALALFLMLVVSPGFSRAATLSEEFATPTAFKPGLIVSNSNSEQGGIQLATLANSAYLLGVVIDSDKPALTFSKEGEVRTTVALTGVVAAYVSDANGEVKKGTPISPSWVSGVGMALRADTNSKIIGFAEEDLNLNETVDYPDIDTPGGKRTVKVGSVAIRLVDPPAQPFGGGQSGISGFTAKLAGKQVSFGRMVGAILILSCALVVCGVFIRNAVRNSFVAIGRNPMATKSVYRALLEVSLVSIAVFLMGGAAAYAAIAL